MGNTEKYRIVDNEGNEVGSSAGFIVLSDVTSETVVLERRVALDTKALHDLGSE